MTRQYTAWLERTPSITAPPRPPTGSSRWIRRTGTVLRAAVVRMTSGVWSRESSTKTISASTPVQAASVRRTSSAMFGASLYVGTMTVSSMVVFSPGTMLLRAAVGVEPERI